MLSSLSDNPPYAVGAGFSHRTGLVESVVYDARDIDLGPPHEYSTVPRDRAEVRFRALGHFDHSALDVNHEIPEEQSPPCRKSFCLEPTADDTSGRGHYRVYLRS